MVKNCSVQPHEEVKTMAHKPFAVDLRFSHLFPKPRVDLKRIAEAIALPLCYAILFYNLHQLAQTYLPGSDLVNIKMALILSVLAVFRSIFKESLLAPIAGLISVGLMFNFLYGSGSLTQFGVIQMQTGVLTVRIKFAKLLILILLVFTVKTAQYIHEVVSKFRVEKEVFEE
jgi:hypothetical protein